MAVFIGGSSNGCGCIRLFVKRRNPAFNLLPGSLRWSAAWQRCNRARRSKDGASPGRIGQRAAMVFKIESSESESGARQLDSHNLGNHFSLMSTRKLTADALALPLAEKVSLAQALWESIDAGVPDALERASVREAVSRDRELSTGTVTGVSHEEAMKAARRAIGCN
ncbi:MAG: hypothetical protein EXS37_16190 [Opitutus sp.]|nr:hypothetical protein [Opitutus sp.]